MPAARESKEFDRVRQAVLLGLFAGTGVGLGFLLCTVLGVELMTVNAALAGVALGPWLGAVAGGLSMAVFSPLNPVGAPLPPLYVAQVLGLALAGLSGGLAAPGMRRLPGSRAVILAGAVGLAATLILDVLTNVGGAVAFGWPTGATLLAGLPVAALHAGVNVVAFATLLPTLSKRLQRLRRPGPRAVAPLLAACVLLGAVPASADVPAVADSLLTPDPFAPPDSAAVALADSLAVVTADSAQAVADSLTRHRADSNAMAFDADRREDRFVNDWNRPLWDPFFASLRENLMRRTYWLPVQDGGLSAPVVLLGEPGTSVAPQFVREGIPLGMGHRYLDDLEAIASVGQTMRADRFGLDRTGGLAGTVSLIPYDPVPDRDLADTRWFKGKHETYLRDLHLLTAEAPWRLGFDFEELLDNEGYDFRVEGEDRWPERADPLDTSFYGHAKFRSGRGILRRDLGTAGAVSLSIENVRKLKSALPAYDMEHQDLWITRTALDWRGAAAEQPARLAVWWLDTDVDWDRDETSYRKQEGARTGALAAWGDRDGAGRLDVDWGRWTLVDSGADASWSEAVNPDSSRWQGEHASLRGQRRLPLGAARLDIAVGGWWDEHGGWLVGGSAALAEACERPRWSLSLERGGRAPRSDELATDWRFVVPGGLQTIALANGDLEREDEWRLAVAAQPRLAGFDLEVSASWRRLRDGIGWQALPDESEVGQWRNGLELDATTVRAAISREGRFLGWIRARAQGTWRSWQEDGDLQFARPPESDWQLSVLWENHFFQEDGILQLAGFLNNRGAMDDPWSLAWPMALPSYTRLDVIVGFRLVGTNLSVELPNVTGASSQYSAGAMGDSSDLRWRLMWVFHH